MNIIRYNDHSALPGGSVATIGFFDGVHLGHQWLMRQVVEKAHSRHLSSMAITFDRHPRQVIHASYVPQLLTTLDQRLLLLAHTGIDHVVVLPFDQQMASLSAREFMDEVLSRHLHVEALLIGYDHHFGRRQDNASEGFSDYERYGSEMGIDVIGMPHSPILYDGQAVSSSAIRRYLSAGNVVAAAGCLSRHYTITGTVTEGFRQGRLMGFPTANIAPESVNTMLPAAGVYEILCEVADPSIPSQPLRGMLNIGTLPTFQRHQLSVEAHLFNFSGDLYGKTLTLSLLRRLRSERRFTSVEALVRQLSADKASILSHEAE